MSSSRASVLSQAPAVRKPSPTAQPQTPLSERAGGVPVRSKPGSPQETRALPAGLELQEYRQTPSHRPANSSRRRQGPARQCLGQQAAPPRYPRWSQPRHMELPWCEGRRPTGRQAVQRLLRVQREQRRLLRPGAAAWAARAKHSKWCWDQPLVTLFSSFLTASRHQFGLYPPHERNAGMRRNVSFLTPGKVKCRVGVKRSLERITQEAQDARGAAQPRTDGQVQNTLPMADKRKKCLA